MAGPPPGGPGRAPAPAAAAPVRAVAPAPGMRAKIAAGPLAPPPPSYARPVHPGPDLLTWIAALGVRPPPHPGPHRRLLHRTAPTSEASARFLVWAAARPHPPPPDIPRQRPTGASHYPAAPPGPAAPLRHRHTAIPVRPRARRRPVLLLYAQPLTRIMRLSAADLSLDETARPAAARRPAQPRPRSLRHALYHAPPHAMSRQHGSHWLFPGRNAGQPAEYLTIGQASAITACRCARPRLRPPPARPAGPCPRYRRRPRLPPHHHHPPARQRRRHLEPLRRPRPARAGSRVANTRQMNTRPYQ